MSSDWDGGNPNPTATEEPDTYPERECPMCGEDCKNLPSHLRHDCEATQ